MEFLSKYAVVIVIGAVLLILILAHNAMFKKRNKVKTAWSGLDVMLKKRYDVMPNLVSMVQKYMTHESELLTKLTELRTQAQNAKDIDDSIRIGQQYEESMRAVKLSVENYPDLKASQNFLQMQATLNDIEEQISAARRNYNAHVEEYNNFIGVIPMNILALILRFKKFNQFEATKEERESKIWM